jgi:hypothetical protein
MLAVHRKCAPAWPAVKITPNRTIIVFYKAILSYMYVIFNEKWKLEIGKINLNMIQTKNQLINVQQSCTDI